MKLLSIVLVIIAGMGLSVEAGILGPLGEQVGHYWATFCLFAVEAALSFLMVLLWGKADTPALSKAPAWQLTGGILGPGYVVILTLVTPVIGVALTMTGILTGQVAKSVLIDHFGLFGASKRPINRYRLVALVFVAAALMLIAGGK